MIFVTSGVTLGCTGLLDDMDVMFPYHLPAPDEGYEWVVDPDYRIPDGARKCRRKIGRREHCRAPAVAEMKRHRVDRSGRTEQWWPYCAEHLADYRHAVGSDGQVWGWRHKTHSDLR